MASTGLTKKELLSQQQMDGKIGLFADVTIAPGGHLDYHEHHGETETYYILEGQGAYNDNGEVRTVKAGDVTFCEDGNGHGVSCTGDEALRFIALIIKK
ncbi:MAG: cupin domain-containing protein [Anaerovoracaceae bacterium]